MVRSGHRRWVYVAIVGVLVVPFIAFRFAGSYGFARRAAIVTPSVYTDAEASRHIGEYATVTGRVVEVQSTASGPRAAADGTTFLDFGGAYPREDFTAVIFGRDRSKFGDLRSLGGRTVQVTGRIDEYRGHPELILDSPGQLRVVP